MRSSVRTPIGGHASARHLSVVAFLGAVLVLLGLTATTPAVAQQEAPANITQDQLEAFAAASLRVENLNEKWMPQISAAETAEDNAALRREALSEMNEAVRDEGLTVQEYNGIYDAAQRDPRLMQVVEEFRKEMQQ